MARKASEAAVQSIGLGYDLTSDLKLKFCKKTSKLITIADHDHVRDIAVSGRILVRNVPKSIKCDKGERTRFTSDVLSFQQVPTYLPFFYYLYIQIYFETEYLADGVFLHIYIYLFLLLVDVRAV